MGTNFNACASKIKSGEIDTIKAKSSLFKKLGHDFLEITFRVIV